MIVAVNGCFAPPPHPVLKTSAQEVLFLGIPNALLFNLGEPLCCSEMPHIMGSKCEWNCWCIVLSTEQMRGKLSIQLSPMMVKCLAIVGGLPTRKEDGISIS